MQIPHLSSRVIGYRRVSIKHVCNRQLNSYCLFHSSEAPPPSPTFSPHHPFQASKFRLFPLASQVQIRGKKTKASISLDDLPQGLLPLEPLPLERDDPGPVYPTVVQQARNHMRKFDNCVLLTRVGGFYELYFEHAEEFGDLLGLKVVSRTPSSAPTFAMVGIFVCLHLHKLHFTMSPSFLKPDSLSFLPKHLLMVHRLVFLSFSLIDISRF